VQDLVAQWHMIVVGQHFPFKPTHAIGKAVGIKTRHRHKGQNIARFAVNHHTGTTFQPDTARSIFL